MKGHKCSNIQLLKQCPMVESLLYSNCGPVYPFHLLHCCSDKIPPCGCLPGHLRNIWMFVSLGRAKSYGSVHFGIPCLEVTNLEVSNLHMILKEKYYLFAQQQGIPQQANTRTCMHSRRHTHAQIYIHTQEVLFYSHICWGEEH